MSLAACLHSHFQTMYKETFLPKRGKMGKASFINTRKVTCCIDSVKKKKNNGYPECNFQRQLQQRLDYLLLRIASPEDGFDFRVVFTNADINININITIRQYNMNNQSTRFKILCKLNYDNKLSKGHCEYALKKDSGIYTYACPDQYPQITFFFLGKYESNNLVTYQE